jgi:hypothetical protein
MYTRPKEYTADSLKQSTVKAIIWGQRNALKGGNNSKTVQHQLQEGLYT